MNRINFNPNTLNTQHNIRQNGLTAGLQCEKEKNRQIKHKIYSELSNWSTLVLSTDCDAHSIIADIKVTMITAKMRMVHNQMNIATELYFTMMLQIVQINKIVCTATNAHIIVLRFTFNTFY